VSLVNKTKEILHKQPLEPAAVALRTTLVKCMEVTAAAGWWAGRGKVSVALICIKHIWNRTGGGVHVMESLYFLSVTSKERCLYRGIHLVAVGSSVNSVIWQGDWWPGMDWEGTVTQEGFNSSYFIEYKCSVTNRTL